MFDSEVTVGNGLLGYLNALNLNFDISFIV